MHETEAYKKEMIRDLEKLKYTRNFLNNCIRNKASIFLYQAHFQIRDSKGKVFANLKIKDRTSNTYVDLRKYSRTLENYPEFKDAEGNLIAENLKGWEINLPFSKQEELLKVVNLFVKKTNLLLYTSSRTQKIKYKPWRDAYKIPVLLVGAVALQYREKLPDFREATRLILKEKNNEISFVINKRLEILRKLPHYNFLQTLGFIEEQCLANQQFIDYIDQ